jgi:Xaa-Pro aminopeptidase
MEYSPNGAIPVVSKVDAGTVELVRGLGHVVVSSANIVQRFTSVLTSGQLAGAAVAAGQVREAIMSGFDLVRQKLLAEEPVTEYDVQKHIMEQMRRQNLVWDGDPIVATGVNASSPHYAPGPVRSSPIERDMVVLIDCWAKHASAGSVYADLTFVGYTADVVPSDVESTFGVIVRARDAALGLVRERFAAGAVIAGYEVDDACRAVVQAAGLTSNFIHRTGHSITTEVHGSGVNMDNYETHDDRHLLPGTTFSIEPGLYFADSLGLRTEIDVVVNADGTVNVPSAPLQMHMLPLLAEAWTA